MRGNPEPHTDGYIWVCLLCPNFTSPNFVMVGEAGIAWQAAERAGFEEWHVVFAHYRSNCLFTGSGDLIVGTAC